MKLNDFLDMLTEVELGQHIFGKKDDGGNYIKQFELINLINRGLENLHTRFLIKKGELRINTANNLRYRHDITNEDHILSPDFPMNIIKVLEVWDERGDRINLNTIHRSLNSDYYKEPSVQMVNKTTLMFDNCQGCYKIIFHAGPILLDKVVTGAPYDLSTVELDIPLEYIDALIYYVASRLFSITQPMDGNAAPFSPGIIYTKRYEEECARLKELNLELEGIGDSTQRFNDSMFP